MYFDQQSQKMYNRYKLKCSNYISVSSGKKYHMAKVVKNLTSKFFEILNFRLSALEGKDEEKLRKFFNFYKSLAIFLKAQQKYTVFIQ